MSDSGRYGRQRLPQRLVRSLRRRVIPDRTFYLPVLSGLVRGAVVPVNFRQDSRIWLGVSEIEIASTIKRLLPEGGTVFDVGAHFGYYSLAFARLGAAQVFAFEPDEDVFASLQEVVSRNPTLSSRIDALPLAVGEVAPAIRVDQFTAEHSSRLPDFMKIDVDGSEVNVLRGAVETIERKHPRMVIEVHGVALEVACLNLLVDHGYVYRTINAQRLWPEFRPIEVNRWIIATHRSDEAVVDVVLRKRLASSR